MDVAPPAYGALARRFHGGTGRSLVLGQSSAASASILVLDAAAEAEAEASCFCFFQEPGVKTKITSTKKNPGLSSLTAIGSNTRNDGDGPVARERKDKTKFKFQRQQHAQTWRWTSN